MIEIQLQKIRGTAKTKVPVKRPTGTTMEYRRTGRKSGREGTGKLDKLPDSIKSEIIELRNINYSGSQIKDRIETMIATDESIQQKLIDSKVITSDLKLTISPQALTDYAKKHGATPSKTHGPKSVESIQAQEKERHEETKKALAGAEKEIGVLEVDVKELTERIKAQRILNDEMAGRYSRCTSELAALKNKK